MGKEARLLRSSSETRKEREDAMLELLLDYDVRHASTYDPNEESNLRRVICAVGELKFNSSVRAMARSLIEDREEDLPNTTFNAGWGALARGGTHGI